MMPEQFNLTTTEKDSALWKKLKEHMTHKLDVARKINDSQMGIEETARQRGKIAMLKELLGLDPDTKAD